jgi:hypothetical protein
MRGGAKHIDDRVVDYLRIWSGNGLATHSPLLEVVHAMR